MNVHELTAPFEGAVPGCAFMLIRDGASDLVETRGYADIEKREMVTPETNFRLASVSKHFTAAAILELRKRGALSLEDTLAQFFPEFPAYGRNITIRQLLMHTSGLLDYETLMEKGYVGQIRDRGVLELLMQASATNFEPGSSFRYSNGGYCLLALILEKASGMTCADFLRSEFFIPLGMNSTVVNEEGTTKIQRRAYGYSRKGTEWIRTDQDATSATIGDGGIYSSLNDLAIWEKAQRAYNFFEERVLTDEKFGPAHYGFGLFTKERHGEGVQYHSGSSIGFRIGVYRIPGKKLSVLFLSNRNEGDGIEMCEKILAAAEV